MSPKGPISPPGAPGVNCRVLSFGVFDLGVKPRRAFNGPERATEISDVPFSLPAPYLPRPLDVTCVGDPGKTLGD